MFQGTIPQSARQIIAEIAASWACRDIYVGCSGNFTIERVLHGSYAERFALHSNDVTLYSSLIGHHFAGVPFRLVVQDAYAEQFGWPTPYLADSADARTARSSTRYSAGIIG